MTPRNCCGLAVATIVSPARMSLTLTYKEQIACSDYSHMPCGLPCLSEASFLSVSKCVPLCLALNGKWTVAVALSTALSGQGLKGATVPVPSGYALIGSAFSFPPKLLAVPTQQTSKSKSKFSPPNSQWRWATSTILTLALIYLVGFLPFPGGASVCSF